MYRKGSFNEKLAKELQKPKAARKFLLNLMEEDDGMELIDALKETINSMGITEYARFSKIPRESVSRMINSEATPKIETLDDYLAPFNLRVKLELEEVA